MKYSKYENEMYEYLTKSENYRAAKDVSKFLANIVDKRLEKDFWAMVKEQIEDDFKNELKYLIEENSTDDFIISKSNWDGVSIRTDNNDIGIEIDVTKIDKEKVEKLFIGLNSDGHLGNKNSNSWPSYFSNYLDQIGDYINILPENRDSKVAEMVNIILKYVVAATSICDEINNLRKT